MQSVETLLLSINYNTENSVLHTAWYFQTFELVADKKLVSDTNTQF